MIKVLLLLTISLIIPTFIGAQENSEERALAIIQEAKKKVFSIPETPIENLFVEFESKHFVPKQNNRFIGIIESFNFTSNSKIWFAPPNKFKSKRLSIYEESNYRELVSEVFKDGLIKESRFHKSDGDTGFSQSLILLNPDREIQKKIEKQKKPKFKYEIFTNLLYIPLHVEGVDFRFVGIATAGKQKAEVIEASFDDIYKLRLFFDQETHLLLMMTSVFYDDVQERELSHKFFYSDYREKDGILFAHKVLMEENNTVIETRKIKSVKQNIRLESDFFDTTG